MKYSTHVLFVLTALFLASCQGTDSGQVGWVFQFGQGDGLSVTQETKWPTISEGIKYGWVGNFNSVSGCQTDDYFGFWVEMPEGNYRAKIILGDQEVPTSTTIKAESRRLMELDRKTVPGSFDTVEMVINVRTPKIDSVSNIKLKSRELNYFNWDANLSLEFCGKCPSVRSIIIEKAEVPTLFLAGNSTVVDQEKEPWASWGQMFPLFLKPEVAVANFAESGESLRSFIGESRLAKIESLIKPGDYLFMEFAHNDQKKGGSYVEPYTTYLEELRKFIDVARRNQATPVLVTSTNRRKFDENGILINTLAEYPDAMRQLAKDEGVLLIDLNAASKKFYEAMGVEGSKKAFVHYEANTFPWQQEALADNTHFSTYGAWQLAKAVVQGILEADDETLKRYIKEDFKPYDPAQPDEFSSWTWPVNPNGSVVKPDGN